jgi:ADP-heptose:LPS heptosyltransferase
LIEQPREAEVPHLPGPGPVPAARENARRKDMVHAVKAALLTVATSTLAARPRPRTRSLAVPAPGGPSGIPPHSRGSAGAARAGPARLLVVRLDNRLGNLLLLTPFLQRLREAFPEAHLGLVSGEAYASLLADWPWIDEWIVQPKRRHAALPLLALPWMANLRRRRWDLAFEASNPDTHSFYNCLMSVAAGAPERLGFDHPRSRRALTTAVAAPEAGLHFSLAPLRLLRALGAAAPAVPMRCPVAAAPSPALAAWIAREGLEKGYVVVHLGGRRSKAWPEEAWARLLPEMTRTAGGPVVLVAGPLERSWLGRLRNTSGPGPVPAPPLAGRDLALLLRDAAGFVGCDSGVMHLAVALGTPTIAMFFRSNPWHYAPLGLAHRTVLLADPFGVDDEGWARPVEGMRRSPVHRALASGSAARAGIPETGPAAAETILRALDGARRR